MSMLTSVITTVRQCTKLVIIFKVFSIDFIGTGLIELIVNSLETLA
jgi:hypothetical protein